MELSFRTEEIKLSDILLEVIFPKMQHKINETQTNSIRNIPNLSASVEIPMTKFGLLCIRGQHLKG